MLVNVSGAVGGYGRGGRQREGFGLETLFPFFFFFFFFVQTQRLGGPVSSEWVAQDKAGAQAIGGGYVPGTQLPSKYS
jgi:hypothetical protein